MVRSIVLFEPDFQVLYEPRFRKCQSGDPWLASLPRQVWKEKMRVRNRKGATELLEANPQYVVLNPLEAKGKWRDLFGNDNPIHVEVGSGKGAFVSGMAKQNPDINYIGIDIQKSVLSYALDKVLEVGVPNIKLLWVDGSDLTDYFEDGEIDRLYLNFSDPWPKKTP